MDFDADGNLYVANGNNVLVFHHGADGNQAPMRVIGGNATGLSANFAIAVDPAGVIYSGTRYTAQFQPPDAYISVFAAGAHGNVSPIRTITDLYAASESVALDKPRTTVPKGYVKHDSDVEDPRPHALKITLHGYFDQPIGNLIVGGGGWIVRPGKPPIPVPPPGGWGSIDADTNDAIMGLVLDELARHMPDAGSRQKVRAELLDSVQTTLTRLRQSAAESPTARASARERAGPVDFLARLLRRRGRRG